MFRFQWNALRVGDSVMVHDDLAIASRLAAGTVTDVQTRADNNDLSIRLSGGAHELLRPRRAAVHLVPFGSDEACWRCDLQHARDTGSASPSN